MVAVNIAITDEKKRKASRYLLENIFNANESNLFFKMPLNETLIFKGNVHLQLKAK